MSFTLSRRLALAAALLAPLAGVQAVTPLSPPATVAQAVASPARAPANRARDMYRHPAGTLAFFGVTPTQTVVEIWPGAGWYTEILAPLLAAKGRYIAATQPPGKYRDATLKLLAGNPARFGKAVVTTFDPARPSAIAPAGTADTVLTFRNVHNLLMSGDEAAARSFADFYRALKPGGVLGVVDHRLPETADAAREKNSGYIKRSTVIRLATAAGFRLAGESEVNANPKDTADWPKGVWTLPPSLSQGEADRARYVAIGESDRMTLKFVKPAR
ncbi:class I SAM-dependent methyltransferase [Sphingomonas solaris]|uniref:Class I SAM-dependent methyltransferase n=1 Tax=Alterirhizorhabdus solaris TaxID=2529389 RepID=A0A558QUS8_9SPHN|nr:class I SAM-dependent methyltransferase [Sphingomonas solaris]TVV70812.1 class I SAM-dependent methyltransferase [Sphingomonas solaris]